jgi:hypothetical protein
MQLLGRTNNGIDGTRGDALGASNTFGFPNNGQQRGRQRGGGDCIRQRGQRTVQQYAQSPRQQRAAGRACIDRRGVAIQGLGKRAATRILAGAALRLRQQAEDRLEARGGRVGNGHGNAVLVAGAYLARMPG